MITVKSVADVILSKAKLNKVTTDRELRNLNSIVCKDLEDPNGLSLNTWKRVFGRIKCHDDYNFSPNTKEVIAAYLECDSWKELEENVAYVRQRFARAGADSSVFVPGNTRMMIGQLSKGDCISITYNPKRWVEAEYIGDNCYRVMNSSNSKLKNSDTFTAYDFTKGDVFRAYDVKRRGRYIGDYVSASHHRVEDVCIRHKSDTMRTAGL